MDNNTLIEITYVIMTCIVIPCILYMFVIPLIGLYYVYWIITGMFCLTSLWVFTETIGSLFSTRCYSTSPKHGKKAVLLLIPAYMDNEYLILSETMESFSHIKYDGYIKVLVVYNSKDKAKTSMFKNAFYEKWNKTFFQNLNGDVNSVLEFDIRENEKGLSKADNINYGLDIIKDDGFDYIGIYDADHHPAEDSVSIGVGVLENSEYDIIQGQCAIRNVDESIISKVVAMEFVDMYNIGHAGRSNLFDLGLFGGSNGIWRTTLLHKVRMDNKMLTEDIDSAFRSISFGAKIVYHRDMISYELAPVTLTILMKQRRRWSQGWFEVSLKHFKPCVFKKGLGVLKRCAIIMLLLWREAFVYFTFHPIFIIIGYISQGGEIQVPSPVQIVATVGTACFGFAKVGLVYFKTVPATYRLQWYWYIMYVVVYPMYNVFLMCLHVSTHCRHFMRKTEWVPTKRG